MGNFVLVVLGLLFSFHVKAHDGLPGYSHITSGECRLRDSADVSVLFHLNTSASVAKLWIYKGPRDPVQFQKNLVLSDSASAIRLSAFPSNEQETVRINLPRDLASFLGRQILVVPAKFLEANPEMASVAYLANPSEEDSDLELRCMLGFEPTEEMYNLNRSSIEKVNHESVCKIEFKDPYKSDWVTGCSGSLVSADKVLTAGHCQEFFSKYPLRVQCGDQKNLEVLNWNLDPKFRPSENSVDNSHDFSVITMNRKIPNKVLQMANSAQQVQNLLQTGSCKHYGFGIRQDDTIGVLHSTTYSFPSEFLGGQAFVKKIFEMSKMIASNPEEFIRSGDSGGPIICQDQNHAEVIVGVHSMIWLPSTAALSAPTSQISKGELGLQKD